MNKFLVLLLVLALLPGASAATVTKEQGGTIAFFSMLAFGAATFVLAVKMKQPIMGVGAGMLIILASAYGILSVFSGLANAFCALTGIVGIVLALKSVEGLE